MNNQVLIILFRAKRSHIYSNQDAKEEIFNSFSFEDLNKLIDNLNDDCLRTSSYELCGLWVFFR